MKLLMENWRRFLAEELVVPTDINKRAISIYDFDETIARSEGHVDAYYKGTDKLYKRMTTQAEYDKVSASGEEYDYDFSNLDYITDPTELVPVTKRLRHDVENKAMQVMILTARAGEYVEDVVRRNPTIQVVHFYDDSHKNIKDMEAARKRLCDLDRVRFFMINQVDEDAEMKKQGSSVCVSSKAAAEADLFDYDPKNPKRGPFLDARSMGFRGPGGRTMERKKR